MRTDFIPKKKKLGENSADSVLETDKKNARKRRHILSTVFFGVSKTQLSSVQFQIKKVHDLITARDMRRKEGYRANCKASYKSGNYLAVSEGQRVLLNSCSRKYRVCNREKQTE